MKLILLIFLLSGVVGAWAADEPPLLQAAESRVLQSYLSRPSPSADFASGGGVYYKFPPEIAGLMRNQSTRTIRSAIASIDFPKQLLRTQVEDLLVATISGTEPGDGWMSAEERSAGWKAFHVPFRLDRAIRCGFPKSNATKEDWEKYEKVLHSRGFP